MQQEKKAAEKVYIALHEKFVSESANEEAGTRSWCVQMPKGTKVAGKDVGGYRMYPLFVDKSKFNENMMVVPLLADREVWLKKPLIDGDGQYRLDGQGKVVYDTVKVSPADLKASIAAERAEYAESRRATRRPKEDMRVAKSQARELKKAADANVVLPGAQR